MKHFCQIIAIVITLFGNSAYTSDSMKQFQDNLEKITYGYINRSEERRKEFIFYSKEDS